MAMVLTREESLIERDRLSGQRGQDAADGLGEDHVPVGVEDAESQTVGCFPLPPVEGDDSRPEDLRGVGPLEEAERQDRRGEGADIQDRREDEVDEEDLDEKRRVPDQLQVAPGEGSGGERGGEPEEGRRQAEGQGAQKRQDGDLQRHQESLKKRSCRPDAALRREEEAGDAVPLPGITQSRRSHREEPDGDARQQEKLPEVDEGGPAGRRSSV